MPGKYTGTVSNWNHPKAGRRNSEGFGFVKVESGEDVGDLFLYADSIKDPKLRSEAKIYGLKNRTRIRFDIEEPASSRKSRLAVNVLPCGDDDRGDDRGRGRRRSPSPRRERRSPSPRRERGRSDSRRRERSRSR